MLRLGKVTDLVMIQSYPVELQTALLAELKILDDNYGSNRDVMRDYGGYIILSESEDDLPEIEMEMNIRITVDGIPEYVDVIRCSNRKVYTSTLFLLGSDNGIVLVLPYDITPQNILNYTE
ncbi:hypothetical protein ACHAL6_00130 [Proteiniclasticum sp. C24MP]|uniref:hypothetical protein n=1 Tax=Proteiniclasticum sp. C24MP TaxID=3374101 RepID=UPI003754F190